MNNTPSSRYFNLRCPKYCRNFGTSQVEKNYRNIISYFRPQEYHAAYGGNEFLRLYNKTPRAKARGDDNFSFGGKFFVKIK
jgi:hypothetical protein